MLPRVLDILNLIFTKKSVSHGKKNTYPLRECAVIISIQWVRCNVYPVSIRTVERCIGDLFYSYSALKKFSKKSECYWSKCTPFLHNLIELFDIAAGEEYRTICEKIWNVKITSEDFQFYQNQQKNQHIGNCSASVDKHWEKSVKRKEKRSNRSRNESNAIISDIAVDQDEENVALEDNYSCDDRGNLDYVLEDDSDSSRKRKFQSVVDTGDDDLPYKYRHVQSGLCSVRPEV